MVVTERLFEAEGIQLLGLHYTSQNRFLQPEAAIFHSYKRTQYYRSQRVDIYGRRPLENTKHSYNPKLLHKGTFTYYVIIFVKLHMEGHFRRPQLCIVYRDHKILERIEFSYGFLWLKQCSYGMKILLIIIFLLRGCSKIISLNRRGGVSAAGVRMV